MPHRPRLLVFGSLAILVAMSVGVPVASAAPPAVERQVREANNDTQKKLLECVTLGGVREHQAAFQEIADENGGTRVAGTAGYEDSVDYVGRADDGRRIHVTTQDPFPFTVHRRPTTLEQLTPIAAESRDRCIHRVRIGHRQRERTPSTSTLVPRGLRTSGCEAADFAGLPRSGRHRAHPARNVPVRAEGRPTPRPPAPIGSGHLQPGQYPAARA